VSPGEPLSISDARVMFITQQRIPVPDSQDRDCVKIAGMALVYAQHKYSKESQDWKRYTDTLPQEAWIS